MIFSAGRAPAYALAIAIGTASASAGCGAGSAARPTETTYADAAGASTAKYLDRNDSPYILEWEPSQHAALDAAMQKGVVVLAYDGTSMVLLPDCRLGGLYDRSAVTPQLGKVKVRDTDSADASTPSLPVAQEVRAGFDRGATLEFEYVVAGRREADRTGARRAELHGPRGACKGATHFVHSAFVGAFRRLTGTSADVSGGARILGVNASAASTSARTMEAQGGDLEGCRTRQAAAEPSGDRCSVPIQLELRPISASIMVRLTLVSFTIEPNDPTGRSWDSPGRPPDPLFALSNGLGFDHRTAVIDDALTGAPSLAIGPFEMTEEGPLILLAFDDDAPFDKEMIGSGQVLLSELRDSPYIDKDLKSSGAVTARLRLQASIEIMPVPVP